MKNKQLLLIIIVLTSFLANSQKNRFEKILGEKNTQTLNLMLIDFENNVLKIKYPNLEIDDAYRKLLSDIVNKKTTFKQIQSEEIKKLFDKSELKRHIYCLPDSVYFGKSKYATSNKRKAVITEYNCLGSNNKITKGRAEFYWREDHGKLDQALRDAKNSDQLNLTGLFIKALKSTKNKTDFLKSYIDYAENMADLRNPVIMSEILLNKKVDLTDFIMKRLILLNIIYRY